MLFFNSPRFSFVCRFLCFLLFFSPFFFLKWIFHFVQHNARCGAQHEIKFLRQNDQMPKSIFPTISENVDNENVLVVKFVVRLKQWGKAKLKKENFLALSEQWMSVKKVSCFSCTRQELNIYSIWIYKLLCLCSREFCFCTRFLPFRRLRGVSFARSERA